MKPLMVVLTLLLAGRSSVATAEQFAEATKGVKACREKPLPSPASWTRETMGGQWSFSMPSECQFVPVKDRWPHGGMRWQCGTVTIELVWGMWGRSSFGDDRQSCTAQMTGRKVLVLRPPASAEEPSIVVWYPTAEPHEPILSVASSKPEDRDLVFTIAMSGRWGPAK